MSVSGRVLRVIPWLLLCANLCAQQQTETFSLDSVQHLDEVVVTARYEKEVIAPQQLSGERLRSLNSLSVADAIRYFSGVQLKDYGGIGGLKTVNIRSMGTNQVGVFYNGVQLGNAQNGQVDLGKFSLDNIELISLYNGQRSQALQSARDYTSASSIYLETRKPKFKPGKNTNVRAVLKAGSSDLINPSLLMEYKISEDISLSFNSEWVNSSGKYKVHYRRVYPGTNDIAYDTVGIRQNGDINAVRTEASLHGALNKGMWNLHFYNYTSERGVPGAIINNVWRRGERIQDINSFVQGRLRLNLLYNWNSLLNVKYASDFTHFENFDFSYYMTNNKFRQKEFYASTANQYLLNQYLSFSLAYDFQWNTLDAEFLGAEDYNQFAFPTRYSHWATVGGALDWNRLKVQANLLGTFTRETVERFIPQDDKNIFTPAVFLSYQLLRNEDLRFNAFYKKIFRLATFNEIHYVEWEESSIKPEYATQYNAGLKYTKTFNHPFFRHIDAQADVYYNEVKDKIICTPKSPMFKWTTYNLGLVKIEGLDVSLGNQFQIKEVLLNTRLQYTYQKARNYTDKTDTYYGHQIPYIPWHSGSVTAFANYKRWTLNYSFIYTGERYNANDNILYNHVQPWYTHDISLMGLFKIKDINLKATIEVNNLLSQDYDVVLNYPMPKRNYRFSIVMEL